MSMEEATCKKHGPYMAFTTRHHISGERMISGCPKCSLERANAEKAVFMEKQQDPEIILQRRLALSGVPEDYQAHSFASYTVDGYDDPRHGIMEEFKRFLDTDRKNLLLIGPTGVGKTHLGCSLIRESLERGRTAHYVKEGYILRQIKSTFGRNGKTEQDIIDKYASYDLLVIDEIGLSPWTEYNNLALSDIIDDRSSKNVKTVYLGNITVQDYKAHFNDQCRSRIETRSVSLQLAVKDHRKTL